MTRAHRRVRPKSDTRRRRRSIQILWIPAFFVRIVSDGASETDEMTDFHRNRFAAGRPDRPLHCAISGLCNFFPSTGIRDMRRSKRV